MDKDKELWAALRSCFALDRHRVEKAQLRALPLVSPLVKITRCRVKVLAVTLWEFQITAAIKIRIEVETALAST